MKLILFVLLLMPALLAFSGCATVAEKVIEKPKVALDKVGVRDVDGKGATLVFAVKVDNPNPFGIKVDALKYDIEIGGKLLSSGKLDQEADVAAKSISIVNIPIPVKFSDIYSSAMDLISNKSSTYRVRGAANVGLFEIPFDEKGDFKIRQ